MDQRAKMNAVRSGIVVIGAVAFGYLTLQLGFKPFLERAQAAVETADHTTQQSQESLSSRPE